MVNWTDDMERTLAEMWMENSASVIGAKLGMTRNAVIGKAGRMALPPKPREFGFKVRTKAPSLIERRAVTPNKPKAAKKPKRRVWNNIRRPENVRPPMHIEAPPAPVEPLNLTLMQLGSGQCHFIAGEPGSGYCGHPAEELGRPYCAFHLRLCYRPLDLEKSRKANDSAEYMARVGG